MLIDFPSVPVKLSPTTSDIITYGVIDVDGLLAYRDGYLTLEYRTLNLGHATSDVKTIKLGLNDLREIILKKQLMRWTIVLRPASMSVFDGLPGTGTAGLDLRVDRTYYEEAERLVSHVALELSEFRLNTLASAAPHDAHPSAAQDSASAPALSGAALPLPPPDIEERREVAAALRRINDAWLNGRPDDLAPLLHDRMVMVHPGFSGRGEGRDAIVAGFADFTAHCRVIRYRESENQVDVTGNTAIASFAFEMIYERDGHRYLSTGRDLWVFAKREEIWLAVWRTMMDLREEETDAAG